MFGWGRKLHRAVSASGQVEIGEIDGIRSMYIDTNTIQSSMRVKAPYELMLSYSRGMMAFLLFLEETKESLLIGLGGGSIPKFIWKNCPQLKQTIVEINPKIIQIARTHFFVPENDERITILEADGLDYLKENANSTQVVLIDAYDGKGIPPDFCSQDFFDDCAGVLRDEGIFAINLWGSDKNFGLYWERIANSFDGKILKLPTGRPGNIIVFALKSDQKSINIKKLIARAKTLEKSLGEGFFSQALENLQSNNPHNQQHFYFKNK
jgi:spermidine synthase